MLKKIGYFLLGAFVATFGYISGGLDNTTADDDSDVLHVKSLHVNESITVGDGKTHLKIGPSYIQVNYETDNGKSNIITLIANESGASVGLNQGWLNKKSESVIGMSANAKVGGYITIEDKNGDRFILSTDTTDQPKASPEKAIAGAITVELVTIPNHTLKNGKIYLTDAVVKKASGEKMHVTFTEPLPHHGAFTMLDQIAIKPIGSKWKFVKFVKSGGF